MNACKKYSHLNGEEYLLVHKKDLYDEIMQVIASIDASGFRTKVSQEERKMGDLLYNPGELNKEFARRFKALGWETVRRSYHVSDEYSVVKVIDSLPYKEQREYLESIGAPLIRSFNETDFVKERVAVEVQFGKYFAVTYDLFVKHMSFYSSDIIDVGVEIVPSKAMQQHMSSGPPFFEKEVHNVLRHGRSSPAVPVLMIGIEP